MAEKLTILLIGLTQPTEWIIRFLRSVVCEPASAVLG
jgi:hypothetical protein